MLSVGKNQIVAEVSARTGLPRATVANVVDTTFEAVKDELKAGNKVNLTGFANFGFGRTRAIRKGTPVRNPITGETRPHEGKKAGIKIRVRPGTDLKRCAPSPGSKAGKEILAK